jgi:hypothetical protein
MPSYTVASSFNISGRGAAAFVDEPVTVDRKGVFAVSICVPNGQVVHAQASQEFARVADSTTSERVAFLVHGLKVEQLPAGSQIHVTP